MKILWCVLFLGLISIGTAQDNELTTEETAAGWGLLFDGSRNGTDGLNAHWTNYARNNTQNPPVTNTWQTGNGEMFITGNSSDIRTKKEYGDFVLKFDYKINGNQGFFYRTTVCGGQPWESAIEVAMDVNYNSFKHSPGDAYDLYASAEQNFRTFNSGNPYNQFTIVGIKDSIEHWQNGEFLLGFKFWSQDFQNAFQNSKWPNYNCFGRPYDVPSRQVASSGYVESGYLGVQSGHGGDLYIKNIKVLEDPVIGCTTPDKENYDPNANYNYEDIVGVTPSAAVDCGADVAPQVPGCMTQGNANYNPQANVHVEDSCAVSIFSPEGLPISYTVSSEINSISVTLTNAIRQRVTLFNVQGDVITKEARKDGSYKITGLQQGIYFLKLEMDGHSEIKRIDLL